MDVNKIIRINYPDIGISGNFVINNISWQIGTGNFMTISAQEAVVVA